MTIAPVIFMQFKDIICVRSPRNYMCFYFIKRAKKRDVWASIKWHCIYEGNSNCSFCRAGKSRASNWPAGSLDEKTISYIFHCTAALTLVRHSWHATLIVLLKRRVWSTNFWYISYNGENTHTCEQTSSANWITPKIQLLKLQQWHCAMWRYDSTQ